MKTDNPAFDSKRERDHERVNLLLPWLVNDTLEETERLDVERHLRLCAACRDDRKLLERLRNGIRNDALTPIVPRADAARLLDRLDRQASPGRLPTGIASKRVAAFAVAASLVAVALTLLLIRADWPGASPVVYETATGGEVASMDYVLRIRFEPDMPAAQRAELLKSLDARHIVDDGADGYRSTVRLTLGSMEQLQQYTADLASMPGVSSAEVVAIQLPVRSEQ